MASVASSSSFFSALTRSHIPPRGNRNKSTRPNFMRIVTRSCLDDSSSLSQAAQYTVDAYVKSGMVVGLGSGQASGIAIRHLGKQLRTGALKDVVGIPMSVTSASEAAKAGIPLDSYQEGSRIDFAFDDADVIEEGSLIAVIGRRKLHGEESILEKKSILNAANKLVFIIEENQYKVGLEGSIPVLVQSLNWLETAEEIDDMFLGDAEDRVVTEITLVKNQQNHLLVLLDDIFNFPREETLSNVYLCSFDYDISPHKKITSYLVVLGMPACPDCIHGLSLQTKVWRRPSIGLAGPLGGDFPLVTKEGHNLLDVIFTSPIESLAKVAENLDTIKGVAGHGVISKFPCTVVIASQNGPNVVEKLTEKVVG